MKISKLLVALPAVALMTAAVPADAEARTKSIVKWGAIGLGAAALGNYMSQPNYYSQPYYGGYSYGYQQPYYGGYSYGYQQPYYSGYSYGYQQPYYGGGYSYGYGY